MKNFDIAKAFGDQFDPPLAPVQTFKINNIPHRDAWMVAHFDDAAQCGITAHTYAGQIHVYIEVLERGSGAEAAGRFFAAALQQLMDERKQMAEGPQDTRLGAQGGDAQQGQG